jgi:hypothetical protein
MTSDVIWGPARLRRIGLWAVSWLDPTRWISDADGAANAAEPLGGRFLSAPTDYRSASMLARFLHDHPSLWTCAPTLL